MNLQTAGGVFLQPVLRAGGRAVGGAHPGVGPQLHLRGAGRRPGSRQPLRRHGPPRELHRREARHVAGQRAGQRGHAGQGLRQDLRQFSVRENFFLFTGLIFIFFIFDVFFWHL